MTAHGGGSPRQSRSQRSTGAAQAPEGRPSYAEAPRISGFGSFIRSPEEDDKFKLDRHLADGGATPRSSPARLQALMRGLSTRMTIDTSPRNGARDNPSIPSGYTYLLQFVAHDLVATSSPFWAIDDGSVVVRNERASRLMLETLYAGGPTINQAPFAPDDELDTSRTKFRLGCFDATPDTKVGCPFRDLGRVAVPSQGAARSEPLIADIRNDDGAVVAQLTVLFQSLHNAIVDVLIGQIGQGSSARTLHAATRRFICAREATTLIYRTIIRNELLPKILHPKVVQLYDVERPPFLDAQYAGNPSGPLPLEFSFGAFRLGHAMVRDRYQLNSGNSFELDEIIMQTSSRNPAGMPLDNKWLVSWSRFFDMGNGVPPNLSQRISPLLSQKLLNRGIFGSIDDSGWFGLPYRDLISAALAGLWSVPALIRLIRAERPDWVAMSSVLSGDAWRGKLATWLAEGATASDLSPCDQEGLATDPPLPFFILFEAEAETGGKTLGVLGSIIAAEVFYAQLADGPLATPKGAELKQQLESASARIYGAEVLKPLYGVNTMRRLIQFVGDRTGWAKSAPDFV